MRSDIVPGAVFPDYPQHNAEQRAAWEKGDKSAQVLAERD